MGNNTGESNQGDDKNWIDQSLNRESEDEKDTDQNATTTSNWINTALDQGTKKSGQSLQNNQDSRLSVAVSHNKCNNCGTATVRAYHNGCGSPIIHIGGEWQCGACGTVVSPKISCGSCGARTDRNQIDIPLDLSVRQRADEIETAIHKETNRRRTAHNTTALEYSPHLSAIALQHSRHMAQEDFFDHTAPNGSEPIDRYRRFGHDTRSSGENIALEPVDVTASADETAHSIVEGWMNSPGHRENILRGRFDEEGLGVYIDPSGSIYATQNFY